MIWVGIISWFTRYTVYCDCCAERVRWPKTKLRGYGQCSRCKENVELNVVK